MLIVQSFNANTAARGHVYVHCLTITLNFGLQFTLDEETWEYHCKLWHCITSTTLQIVLRLHQGFIEPLVLIPWILSKSLKRNTLLNHPHLADDILRASDRKASSLIVDLILPPEVYESWLQPMTIISLTKMHPLKCDIEI